MTQIDFEELNAACKAVGLKSELIAIHAQRIQKHLNEEKSNFFRISDTGRLENGLIISQAAFAGFKPGKRPSGVAFVPAAGASSRYFSSFEFLRSALVDGKSLDPDALRTHFEDLPLPPGLLHLLEKEGDGLFLAALDALALPKGLLPCVVEGTTFLAMKHMEHEALKGLIGEVFVAPLGQGDRFLEQLKSEFIGNDLSRTHCIEQGPEQSTLRFDQTLRPVKDYEGGFSVVPAGHGTLAELIPMAAARFEGARFVFIRNIDNICGLAPRQLQVMESFLAFYETCLDLMEEIRDAVMGSKMARARSMAIKLGGLFGIKLDLKKMTAYLKQMHLGPCAEDETYLWALLRDVFHFDFVLLKNTLGLSFSLATMKILLQRPLNILGQVPNTSRQVGGSPVLVDYRGAKVKVCLELPHASAEDQEKFLKDPSLATHFNPVFVAAEANFEPRYYLQAESDFWILAKKQYQGQTVYYHETVLYELLGNSLLANVLFLEVPSSMFSPHKAVEDARAKTLSYWQHNDA